MKAGMDAAAEMLDLEPRELKSALQSGSTLAEIADAAGISTEDLKTTMAEAIAGAAPREAAERMTANLDDVIAGDRPPRPRHREQSTDLTSVVDTLASALDTTSEELIASMEAGSLVELFANAGLEAQTGVLVNADL